MVYEAALIFGEVGDFAFGSRLGRVCRRQKVEGILIFDFWTEPVWPLIFDWGS
jgi:hypothetical protein